MRKLGWHILRETFGSDATLLPYPLLPHGDRREVRPGQVLGVAGPVVLCVRGLHAASTPWSAWHYVSGHYLCRVAVSGTMRDSPRGEAYHKFCGSRREVLWMVRLLKRDRELLKRIRDGRYYIRRPNETKTEYNKRLQASRRADQARFMKNLAHRRRMK